MAPSPILKLFVFSCFGFVILSCTPKQNTEIHLSDTEQISYNFHIRPILSDKCFVCHGPDANKRESELRLDTEAGAYAALKEDPTQFVIKPGNLGESTVYHRIISEDPGELMPPP